MKQAFLWIVVILIIVAMVGYAGWRIIQAFASIGEDWKAGKEAAGLKAEKDKLAAKREAENAARLDNGCEHRFDEMYGAFPPGVCCKCGVEERRPSGICDHVWRKLEDAVPGSRCEKCGKQHGGSKRT